MGLFDKLKRKNIDNCICSPVDGTIQSLENVNDGMFSEKMLGDGIAVIPNSGEFVAPVSGTIETAFPTSHAFGIKTDNNLEVLIHIGIDTVEMNGNGFNSYVNQGQTVKKGDKLASVDLEKVKNAGYSTTTMVIITSGQDITYKISDSTQIKASDKIMEVNI